MDSRSSQIERVASMGLGDFTRSTRSKNEARANFTTTLRRCVALRFHLINLTTSRNSNMVTAPTCQEYTLFSLPASTTYQLLTNDVSHIPRTLSRYTPIVHIALPGYHVNERISHWRSSYSILPTTCVLPVWLLGDRQTTA
jgi:hypothetical protein